jgi:predicted phosphoribosyltransferase
MAPIPYTDRDQAGQMLAAGLLDYAGRSDVVVLGLPRGGVPVAAPVAAALRAPLDVLVVRKIGLPDQPELAMGAVAGVGEAVEVLRNDRVLAWAQISDAAFDSACHRELADLREREASYRRSRAAAPLGGRVVILVDDGLATGSTMRAAIAAVRRRQPARLVVAVPVAAKEAYEHVRSEADDVVCGWTPDRFIAVGQAYQDFTPTTDEQVRQALATEHSAQTCASSRPRH